MIIGGGTGGHITPGIAIYEDFKKKEKGVIFLTGKGDKRFFSEGDVNPDELFSYGAPTFSKNITKIPLFIVKFFFAYLKAKKIIKKQSVSSVIGMGGYVSAPALLAAKRKKVEIFLCEQNSVPGKVSLLFEKYAEKIYATFEISQEYFKEPEKFVLFGNPIRKKVLANISKEDAKKKFNLSHSKHVVLVIGGSQGALKINELICDLKRKFPDMFKDVGLIWSTGTLSYEKFKNFVQNESQGGAVYISPYIDNVGEAYKASDLAISRSGAGVMMELAAMGLPSVFIPYPFAAMDHQNKNADAFVKEGAAIKVLNKDATIERFAEIFEDLLMNPRKLSEMSTRASSLAKIDAASKIADDVLKNQG